MLLELNIRNFILIEDLQIQFHPKLNIFTGETGAGKSIILEGIQLCLGKGASKEQYPQNDEKTYLEIIFELSKAQQEQITSEEVDLSTGLVVISREIYPSGKSISRINGTVTNLKTLRSITEQLIDIHGQHAHQSLLNENNHLKILDQFGDKDLSSLKKEVALAYEAVRATQQELYFLENELPQEDVDFLSFQLKEINEVGMEPGEYEKIESEFDLLSHSEEIKTALEGTSQYLQADQGAIDLLKDALYQMRTIEGYDHAYKNLSSRLDSSIIEIEDIAAEIERINTQMDFDDSQYQYLEERLSLMNHLLKKYGPQPEDVFTHERNIEEKLELLQDAEHKIERLKKRLQEAKKIYLEKANSLTIARKGVFSSLKQRIIEEIATLNLSNVRFDADFQVLQDESGQIKIHQAGIDKVGFLISTNPGLPMQALSKVASGGEISRIMLGIKSVTAGNEHIDTMLFDEIDTGISGEAAMKVAIKMNTLAKEKQIVAITHLPQIAAMADRHFKISKDKGDTQVEELSLEQGQLEISRIISGRPTNQSSLESAKEMVQFAKDLKKERDA